MRRQRRGVKLLAFALGLALVAAACGNDDDAGTAADEDEDAAADETGDEEQAAGGDLILGQEQWPECLNVITQCANASWLNWGVTGMVLPDLMELTPENEWVPSPVLEGEPELSGEGLDDSGDPFTIVYNIAEDAVWDDGTPITSTDIKFTWEARMNTTGTLTTSGYEDIADIDDSDPKTAVITFDTPFADWQKLFGPQEHFIKADAFEGPDVADEMQGEIPFSGKPFVLEAWSTDEARFVPNENYWDDERVPLVDSMTTIPLEDTETEATALLAGEVHAIFPQQTPGIGEVLGDSEIVVGLSPAFEELWFTMDSRLNENSPQHDVEVREAIAHAIDRETALQELVQVDLPEVPQLNCNNWVPGIGPWCDESDWEDFEFDPELSQQILEDAGWTLGSDGIYEKDGQRLSVTFQTVAGNQRREDFQALVIPQLQEIGIEVQPDNHDAGTLFEQRAPQRQTELAMYAQVSDVPSVTTFLGCNNIGTEENDFAGQNIIGWCNEEATELMLEADRTPDEAERLELMNQAADIMREDVIALPLWPLANLTAFDGEVLEGPVGEYSSTAHGGFFNVWDWSFA